MRWILIIPLLVLAILFGLSNRGPVTLQLWPLDQAWTGPLSTAVLVIAAVAFFLGAFMAWGSALPARRRAKRLEEDGKLLNAELAELRTRAVREGRAAPVGDPTLLKLSRSPG